MSLPEDVRSQRESYGEWTTSADYSSSCPDVSPAKFMEVMDVLLERPNMNSTYLFRADILHDSARKLQTLSEKDGETTEGRIVDSLIPPIFQGFVLERTVVRRLIPRKPQIDRPIEQSCFTYVSNEPQDRGRTDQLVVCVPHVKSEAELPWYHPLVQALAYRVQRNGSSATLSVHYKPFTAVFQPPPRLHRTFLSLLQTTIRLAKIDSPMKPLQGASTSGVRSRSTLPSVLKDTILPQHIVQDTYSRLKQVYAADLIDRWVEKTDPSKHVFEDLAIAAFLIELWKRMYESVSFPGFVDLACGNGILVYVLLQEGFAGEGFDARRRKTWTALGLDNHIKECVCVPKPFLNLEARNTAVVEEEEYSSSQSAVPFHAGIFKPGTFIVSNHTDELTPWIPMLAALSNPLSPLPFLAIPCCSHALSGVRHRYTLKDIDIALDDAEELPELEQPAQGDLRALRAEKQKAAAHADDKSQYACLTKKVVALAEEIGFDVEMTLMRIPSTRNIGIVGNRQRVRPHDEPPNRTAMKDTDIESQRRATVARILERECVRDGGVRAAAQTWIENAKKLQAPKGRGKLNLKGKLVPAIEPYGSTQYD